MAQTPQSEETGGAGETTTPGTGRPPGVFGSSTTILLLILGVTVFWWNRRRRVQMELRVQNERREAEAAAERSALDVANLMRATSHRSATASASEGLASAALDPSPRGTAMPPTASIDSRETAQHITSEVVQPPSADDRHDAQALLMERADARAVADRAAEEQAQRALRNAANAGESAVRRAAAAAAAAAQADPDTVDAERAGQTATVPAGAVAGDGTANCPPDYPIKGNRQSRIYHNPGQVSYPSTIPEFCFASAEDAELAGYRGSRAREHRSEQ